jgi:tRNA nucleotidyltransferase (CCA-adding enzyme)
MEILMRVSLAGVPAAVVSLAQRVEVAGGNAVLVGGAVIDMIQCRTPKDWDLEVFGLGYDSLVALFSDLNPKLVGKQFGIIKLTVDGLDVDINVPRRDNKVGVGHDGIECDFDPTMTVKEAARRRDFSINAMALDLHTGEVIDPFGGLTDLTAGVLRATDPALFVQDPLRALRAMQLLARKAKTVDPHTMQLIRGMVDLFPELSAERVYEEWRKLLLKAERPSVGLEFLRESGWLVHFPEFQALIGCEQNPEWHPEGDVWIHSCHTVDSAAWVRSQGVLPEEWVEAFMFGTMCHDLGKPDTTITPEMVANDEASEERLWTAWGHDRAGMPHGESFLRRMTNNKDLIKKTTTIIGEHMQPFNLWQGEANMPAYKRLHNRIRLDVLGWVCRCDSCGGPDVSIGDPDLEHETSQACWARFGDIGPDPVKAILMGRHLIDAGLQPGRDFKARLDAAYNVQLDGVEDVNTLLGVALAAT